MDDIDIVLNVDGQEIPMNDFVRKIISGTIAGAIGTLRDVGEDWKTIDISLRR
ncbi:Uncharacterised protein [uncultured archaeon]|nr:Uncharacterised protein [uncultured archaeon]